MLSHPLERRVLLSTYYVATNGLDTNPGTALDQPLKTIQAAAQRAVAGDTVLVRGGTYRETIKPANSGTAAAPITFAPYNNETVTVSGADLVAGGWSLRSGAIYRAARDLDLGAGNNQVFVDGKMMNEARWPNTSLDVSRPKKASADTVSAVFAGQASYATLTDAAQGSANFASGAWDGGVLHISSGQGWVTQTASITGSTAAGSLSFDYAQRTSNFKSDRFETPEAGDAYFLTGKFVGLDSAGEWFLDSSSDTLYLWTPKGDSPSTHVVEAKARQYAFDLSGRSYVDIEGLHVFAATIVTDAQSTGVQLDGIDAQYVSQFSRSPTGWEVPITSGIYLAGENSVLRNSTIAFSAGHGVAVTGAFSRVENNVIHDVGYSGVNGSGIRVSGTGHVVRSNTIYNAGRIGILHAGLAGGRVVYNTIHDVMLQATDGGGIYAFGSDGAGTEIAYNRIYNVLTNGFGGAGLYLDNGSSNHVVHHNLVYNVNHGIKLNPPSLNNQVFNNTLLGVTRSVASSGDKNMAGSVFRNNVFNKPVDIGAAAVQQANVYSSTPALFVDAAAGDYRLQPTSPGVDDGVPVPPYTDGYAGSAPDAGAFEIGRPAWTSGADDAPAVPDDDAPASPGGLTATASAAGVTLDWSDGLDPDRMGYYVYRAASAAGPFTGLTEKPLASSRYLDPDAPLEAMSYYRIVALDTSDNASAPASASASVRTPGAVPPAPTNLLAAPASATAIDLAWNVVPDVFGYRIERKAPGESAYREIARTTAPALRDGGLTAGATYDYRVRAENLRGVSNPSAAVAALPLAAPAGLKVTVAGPARTELSWSNVTGETRFDIQRSRDGKAGWLTIAATQPDVTAYADVSVPTSVPYFYRVVAVGPGGASRPGEIVGTQSVVSAFESVDINATPAGDTTVVDANTAFDVTAGGADINGAADRFRFVHQQLTGDFDIRVRLESLSKASAWTKAGLMARENLGAGSRNVFVLATPDVNGYRISSRLSEGGRTLVTGAAGAAVAYPNTWLRLRRTGATFTGYRSSDGINWFVLGSRTVNLPATVHFGMAVTSHNTAATATAKFRDLSNVPKPDPEPTVRLAGVDVGAAAPAGATAVVRQGSDYDLTAGGTDVNGATDRFHFAYRQVTGDFDVKVRLQSLGATSDWAKAGIMAREDLTGGSRNVFALATPGANGYRVSSRSDANGSTFVSGGGAVSYPNTWLRLRRRGDAFDAFRSTDGVAWTQVGSTRTIDLPDTIHLGLAATSHNTQVATRAEFRELGNV